VESSDRFAIQQEVDVNVTSCGVGVRTDRVGRSDKFGGGLSIADRLERYVERDGELVAAVADREQAHCRVDRDFTSFEFLAASDASDDTLETRRVPHGEQLVGIRSTAWAPISLGARRSTSSWPSAVRAWPPRPSVT
jgi:hypothetical protein